MKRGEEENLHKALIGMRGGIGNKHGTRLFTRKLTKILVSEETNRERVCCVCERTNMRT
jgi:hypothetical protein